MGKGRGKQFVFITRRDAPPTNNLSERLLRKPKFLLIHMLPRQPVLMFARGRCLERRHHTGQHVSQVALNTVKLMRPKSGGEDATVCPYPLLELKKQKSKLTTNATWRRRNLVVSNIFRTFDSHATTAPWV